MILIALAIIKLKLPRGVYFDYDFTKALICSDFNCKFVCVDAVIPNGLSCLRHFSFEGESAKIDVN